MKGLSERLAARIRDEGPISFAAFMEEALYDPSEGFYADPPIGKDRHYVTSPHVSTAFADLLATQLGECRAALGTGAFTVVEMGAGDGTLAGQILSSGAWDGAGVRYVAVERSRGAREALQARGLEVAASPSGLAPFEGVLLANEMLDNVPFHRLRRRRGNLVEVFVGESDGGFAEVEGPPTQEALAARSRDPFEGEDLPVSPGWRAFVRDASSVLVRGWALVFDYGFFGGAPAQSVRGYAAQRLTEAVLEAPGSRDISTGVDFDAVTSEARDAGLDVWGPVTQREALRALGYPAWMDALRARQAKAEAAGDHRAAVRLFAERTRAPMLVDETQLGGLFLLALGRDVGAPRAAGF